MQVQLETFLHKQWDRKGLISWLLLPASAVFLSMAASAVSFFAVYYGFHTVLGNHALWLAFLVYLSMRGAMQTLLSRKVMEKSFH